MGRKNKLKKYHELSSMPNVYENTSFTRFDFNRSTNNSFLYKGKWHNQIFSNEQPITLELACGKGEYSVQLAERYTERNFIGVDIKGNRIWKGAKYALDLGISNVAFLRTRIELLELFFDQGEIDEIWITFPDPFLKKSRINNRLTSPRFLDIYSRILSPGGLLHLKTDDPTLYQYSLESIQEHPNFELEAYNKNIYQSENLPHPDLDIRTYYEHQHLAEKKTIKYIGFKLKSLKWISAS